MPGSSSVTGAGLSPPCSWHSHPPRVSPSRRHGRMWSSPSSSGRSGGSTALAAIRRLRSARCPGIRARGSSWHRSTPPTAILRGAIRAAGLAAEATPTAQAVALLGDLLERAGRPEAARRQRATVAVIDRLLAANGVRADLETAVYRADNAIRPDETVALARRARAARPSIYGDDAARLGARACGSLSRGDSLARRSLRLGTRDALLYFHRGYAERCAGDVAGGRAWFARALDLNAAFSVRWAPVARALLSG